MATSDATAKRPLWLSIEEQISKLDSQDLSSSNLEASVQRIAGELDGAGYNVSRHGGNLIQLRFALEKAGEVGSPFMKEFNAAVSALTLEDAADPYGATNNLLEKLSPTWPEIKMADRRPDVIAIVEQTKLDLLIAKAKGMDGDTGIRLLIEEEVDFAVITKALGITDEKRDEVHELIKKERAERERVAGLLEKVVDKSADEKIRHLFDNDVTEALIIEMAGVDQAAIDGVKKAMEAELKEKQRLAEEEAARKKKEAEGPSLEDMSAEDMAYYIDQIREIMEFSEEEKEIRVMCEQSSVPKALVEIAVSDPGKLDELEKQAQG
jgi:uncharacterized protein YaaQ